MSVLRAWLARFRRDQPDYLQRMRALWQVPSDWTIPQTAKVIPTRKVQTFSDWMQKHGMRKSA